MDEISQSTFVILYDVLRSKAEFCSTSASADAKPDRQSLATLTTYSLKTRREENWVLSL